MEDIEEIYKKYANLIKNYIFFITKDKDLSEEIMQETFIVAINGINFEETVKSLYGFDQLQRKSYTKD